MKKQNIKTEIPCPNCGTIIDCKELKEIILHMIENFVREEI